ncbi:MAG: isocitrate/isopropylmalate family dehydrogenase, partial [Nitrososphaeraceae archaeon]|nr:isocitrate/isopropylmalate family dehydrogenase [Nitrososphaeraceae archaeon]
MTKKAIVIKGDGTGPELVSAMMKVLKACNTSIEMIPVEAGSEYWEKNKTNSYISDEVWNMLSQSDACFKGPTTTIPIPQAPRSVAVSIRQRFELYANIRPIKTYKVSKLRLDFVCVREATEGLYAGIEFKTSDDSAVAIRKITRKGCERVTKKAFQLANDRGFKKLFAITKRNILKETDGIFMSSVEKFQREFNSINVEEYYI